MILPKTARHGQGWQAYDTNNDTKSQPMSRNESRCNLVANSLGLWLACPMLTHSQFVLWRESRRSAGESLAAIGSSLGVSHTAVKKWQTVQYGAPAGRAALPRAAGDGPWPADGRRAQPEPLVVLVRVCAQAVTPFARFRRAGKNCPLMVVVGKRADGASCIHSVPID